MLICRSKKKAAEATAVFGFDKNAYNASTDSGVKATFHTDNFQVLQSVESDEIQHTPLNKMTKRYEKLEKLRIDV